MWLFWFLLGIGLIAIEAVVAFMLIRALGWGSGLNAALAASIFHDGMYTVKQAKGYLGTRGVLVRGGSA